MAGLTCHEELGVRVIVDVEFEAFGRICKIVDVVGVDDIFGRRGGGCAYIFRRLGYV